MRACIARRVAECCKGKNNEEGWITTVIQPSSLFLSCNNEQMCIYLPLSCIKPGMGFFSFQTAWRTLQGFTHNEISAGIGYNIEQLSGTIFLNDSVRYAYLERQEVQRA
jgi:hypothetical protein